MITLKHTSRLRFARLFEIGNPKVECWELPEYPKIENNSEDIIYTVRRKDRIDLLSQRFYGTPDLWWVIALANDLRLLPNDLVENQKLRIPTSTRVYSDILRRAVRRKEGL